MAKLYFRYGTVGSAKTLNLLAVAHNYRQQSKEVFLIKPKLDVRFGKGNIKSRAGLETEAHLLVESDTKFCKLEECKFENDDNHDMKKYFNEVNFRKQLYEDIIHKAIAHELDIEVSDLEKIPKIIYDDTYIKVLKTYKFIFFKGKFRFVKVK